jgi:hypothetical protein
MTQTTDTAPAGGTEAEEATMNGTTTLVICPEMCGGRCGGEAVEARGIGNKRVKTVRVMPCSYLIAQGWMGHQAAFSHEHAATRLVLA